jgi:hypothetical protein
MIWIPCLPNTGDSDPNSPPGMNRPPLTQACRNLTVQQLEEKPRGAVMNDPRRSRRSFLVRRFSSRSRSIPPVRRMAGKATSAVIWDHLLSQSDCVKFSLEDRLAPQGREQFLIVLTNAVAKRNLSSLPPHEQRKHQFACDWAFRQPTPAPSCLIPQPPSHPNLLIRTRHSIPIK